MPEEANCHPNTLILKGISYYQSNQTLQHSCQGCRGTDKDMKYSQRLSVKVRIASKCGNLEQSKQFCHLF
jgi:hypothetical protein